MQASSVYLGLRAGAVPDAGDTAPWGLYVDPTDGKVYVTDNTNIIPLLIDTVTLDALHRYKVHVTTAGVMTVYVDGILKFTGAVVAATPTFDHVAFGRNIDAAGGVSTLKLGWDNILLTLGDVAYDGNELLAAQAYVLHSGYGGMIDLSGIALACEPGSAGGGSVEILVVGL